MSGNKGIGRGRRNNISLQQHGDKNKAFIIREGRKNAGGDLVISDINLRVNFYITV